MRFIRFYDFTFQKQFLTRGAYFWYN